MDAFVSFFGRATGGLAPHEYQRRIAAGQALPALIEIPPGYGKTAAIVLAWLWRRRFHPDQKVRPMTPRRLVYALPQRALTDQVAREIEQWLANLAIAESDLSLHVIMGGRARFASQWRTVPERDSILVGTIDMITSKALVRGYGVPRNVYPMDAALIWNDAHVVIDEVQGAPATTVTFRQVDAFRKGLTIGPSGLTCMSATVPPELIDTVDNPAPADDDIVRLGVDEEDLDLARRRAAGRTVRQLHVGTAEPRALALHALARHRPGRLTLIIVNTVKTAREIDNVLKRAKGAAEVILLHSQFRPVDRGPRIDALSSSPPPGGRIVVSTQVVEAGIDIDSDVLVTEAAPWSSLIQRSGRCNRRGLLADAELWWASPAKALPYESADLAATEAALTDLEGQAVTNEALLSCDVAVTPAAPPTVRRTDFYALFDTSPDLSGHDLDIGPYVRDTEDLAVQVCWLSWPGTKPPDDLRPPEMDHRCRVPLGGATDLIKAGKQVWRFDPVDGTWRTLAPRSPARPGDVLIVRADSGGYRDDIGFDPGSSVPVRESHVQPAEEQAGDLLDDAASSDTRSFVGQWVSLNQHLRESGDEARALVTSLDLDGSVADDIVLAAGIHDVGKAHPIWQDALCRTAAEHEAADIAAGRPWAKSSDSRKRLRYEHGIRSFRHELAGVALLDGPLAGLLQSAHDQDLVRYLVLAHHGKLRVQIRDPRPQANHLLGLRSGDWHEIPAVLNEPAGSLMTTLARFDLAGDDSVDAWPDVVRGLITRYGVVRLAFFETLVQVADWRASARHDSEASS